MILADTSVVIAYERSAASRLTQIIQANQAAVCGITVAEMLTGVRSPADEARCLAAFAPFHRLTIPDALWEAADCRFRDMRRRKSICGQNASDVAVILWRLLGSVKRL